MRTNGMRKQLWMAGTMVLLMVSGTLARMDTPNSASGEVIQPSHIHSLEPFTFAITGTAEGEVINVKTVEGEVVATAKPDRHGRVFLPSGLAAGSYSIATARTGEYKSGLNILTSGGAGPRSAVPAAMSLADVPHAIDLANPVRISGSGFSPDAADMTVNNAPVLAATLDELVSSPLVQAPGMTEIRVNNAASGQSVASAPVLAYTLKGRIERRKLLAGEQTTLEFQFEPHNRPVQVEASIVSGPVSFGAHRQSAVRYVTNGFAALPIVADAGRLGPFTVAWTLLDDEGPKTPQQWVQKKAEDCATASGMTTNSKNEKELGKEAELDDKTASDSKLWDKDGNPTDKDKFAAFLNAEIARLRKIATREGSGGASDKIADAIESAYKAGKAAGLKLEGK